MNILRKLSESRRNCSKNGQKRQKMMILYENSSKTLNENVVLHCQLGSFESLQSGFQEAPQGGARLKKAENAYQEIG